jgi:hypothetical protein
MSVYPDNPGENIDKQNKIEVNNTNNDWVSTGYSIFVFYPNEWTGQSEVDKKMLRQMNLLLSRGVQGIIG